MAVTDTEKTQAQRFLNAKCSPPFVRNFAFQKVASVAEDGREKSHVKASPLSRQRGIATNPILDLAMRQKYEAIFSRLRAEGILKTDYPLPSQSFSADEVGWMPKERGLRCLLWVDTYATADLFYGRESGALFGLV